MTLVVGPFTHGVGHRYHVLRVEFSSGLDHFTGRTICGFRGIVRSTWQMHRMEAAGAKLKESSDPCGRCVDVIEKRWGL